ncbi:MAG: 3-dehydroquinate synthase [Gemmatimonadota bacterium]
MTLHQLDGGGYPVLVGRGSLSRLPDLLGEWASSSGYAVISDSNVAALYGGEVVEALQGAGLSAHLFTFPAGEASKKREEWARLGDALLEYGLDRRGGVIALGGGVTGDLAGFVAATYLRGVTFVQVPTSLLAMVDASVGGKTGIDVPAGKNLVGAFHAPKLVVADPNLLATLPPEERLQGAVEAAKHGAVRDAGHWAEVTAGVEQIRSGDPGYLERLVARSVALKADVVRTDFRESGLRQILNFGHSLGHAVEAASGYAMPHGSAVALGMIMEAEVGEAMGVTQVGTTRALEEFAHDAGLPTRIPPYATVRELMARTATDKKNRDGALRFVLLKALGEVDPGEGWSHGVDPRLVETILERRIQSHSPAF